MADDALHAECAVSLEAELPAVGARLELRPDELALITERGLAQVVDPVDIAAIEEADYLLRLHTSRGPIEISRLGGRHAEVAAALRDARNGCLARALLCSEARLHDLFEAECAVAGMWFPAEVRLYDTRLALHPDDRDPLVIEYGDLRVVRFDEATYATVLELEDGGTTTLGKLGRRSREVPELLHDRLLALARWVAAGARQILGRADGEPWRDGRSVPLGGLNPGLLGALIESSGERAPYIEALLAAQPPLELRLGLKLLATDDFTEGFPLEIEDEDPGPLRLCAWLWAGHALEILGEEDRATYVFDPARAGLPDLERCLRRIQFRRDPIRIEDSAAEASRYDLALGRVPELQALRGACRGRAIHSSPSAWLDSLRGLTDA